MTGALKDRLQSAARHEESAAAALAWERLRTDDGDAARRLRNVLADRVEARLLLDSIFAASPFLTDLILRDPESALTCLLESPEQHADALIAETALIVALESEAEFKRALRRIKAKSALLVALADIGGVWPVETVVDVLTRFADAMLSVSVNWLLREAARLGRLTLADPERPGDESGYVVLAMGKHGAGELNYSSDVDLIVLFDPESAKLAPALEPSTFFVRLTKRLVALLQDMTEDGYAYRVDLRLRPDPRATQIAIALEAAAIYYENLGQNWERAAMIKARPVAGDIALGEEFLARLRPYIWRKYLDFAAIADIHSLKRQIHAVKGHDAITALGHNIKLGRGGIREIEFFVQTQQLIAGGRNPALRGRRTLEMLDALAEALWITPAVADRLKRAYRFLRFVEHRLQMLNDEQTQTLPDDPQAFDRFARFCGYPGEQEFKARITNILSAVQRHYAALFEDAPELGTDTGSLVFTGGEDDPETIMTLTAMGYRQPSEVAATVRGWHFGRYTATRSARSRELLTELMPALLVSLARAGDADQAFIAFDRFLAGLPAGVQLFSLLKANPRLLSLIAIVLGAAPRLAEQLSRRPKVLDAVLDRRFFGPLPRREEIWSLAEAAIPEGTPIEEALDRARVLAHEQIFRFGVRILSETVSAGEAGSAFSALAEVMLRIMLRLVAQDIRARHGEIPGSRVAILAMGKLGGREMTASSDLDLILIYDVPEGTELSDGKRPLSPNQYFTRLTQRLISAVTAPTAEGVLYEVDMRLRPSGNKGPVATSLAAFNLYHRESAWTWERLALTRARVVAGDPEFGETLAGQIRDTLCRPADLETLRRDVLDMRRLMLTELGKTETWDIKRAPGGLIDIEFIAQYLQLAHAHAHPEILDQNTAAALSKIAAAGVLGEGQVQPLKAALALYQRLTQVLRLCVATEFSADSAPAGLARLLANASEVPDLARAEALLLETRATVSEIFKTLIGPYDLQMRRDGNRTLLPS
ncbi:MAG: bifunctional [glutamine synthetase] adenylyltransferase/[glutamine synthetase]-adenylyl-L-tyrosine phosphorylase [Rhizobiales bacterium]|nr:bifunctional [glutamine synthetase] adenylyltransferase/[glutamine synthetase]-adenylyl-L-tyrosine phosphorylase [Hyphomicrobiales bacterium]